MPEKLPHTFGHRIAVRSQRAVVQLFSLGLMFLLLPSSGCKSDPNREMREHELRLLEDEIYYLQDAYSEACEKLKSTQRENEALKKDLGINDPSGAPSTLPPPKRVPLSSSEDIGSPDELPPAPRERRQPTDPDDLILPKVELEGEVDPLLPGGSSQYRSRPSTGIRAVSARDDLDGERFNRSNVPTSGAVKISLNRRLTGGHNVDRIEGDEGVMVVFAPKDQQDQLVEEPGEVSIVLVDPDIKGPAGRVARWNFRSDEVAQHFKKTTFGEGYHFELRWPNRPPQSERLVLFVRLTTLDGRRLEANQTMLIQLSPGANVARGYASSRTASMAVERTTLDRSASGSSTRTGQRQSSSGQSSTVLSDESRDEAARLNEERLRRARANWVAPNPNLPNSKPPSAQLPSLRGAGPVVEPGRLKDTTASPIQDAPVFPDHSTATMSGDTVSTSASSSDSTSDSSPVSSLPSPMAIRSTSNSTGDGSALRSVMVRPGSSRTATAPRDDRLDWTPTR
ncbi:MAG: hypothetical protein SGJ20_22600 [Planctomycetota bacterium]|nr:hypothetical protein [Planctomycetota bacterium]